MKQFWQDFDYLLIIGIIIIVAFVISRILKYILTKSINASVSVLKTDPTNYHFLKNAVNAIIILITIISIFYTIPSLKQIGVTLLASAGLLTVIVGFASQQAFSNIIAGIFIVIFKTFRVDDHIEIGEQKGIVEDITLRHTVIRNLENRRVIIPNTAISEQTIINSDIVDEKVCTTLDLGIGYDSDLNNAFKIITEEAIAHNNFLDIRTKEEKQNGKNPIDLRVVGWGDSSINLRAYIWAKSFGDGFVMKCDLFKSIKEKFDIEGIEIPYPHRTIIYKNKN